MNCPQCGGEDWAKVDVCLSCIKTSGGRPITMRIHACPEIKRQLEDLPGEGWVKTAFFIETCEALQKEREDARAANRRLVEDQHTMLGQIANLKAENAKLCAERDHVIEQRKNLRAHLVTATKDRDAALLKIPDMMDVIQDHCDLISEQPADSTRPFIKAARARLEAFIEKYKIRTGPEEFHAVVDAIAAGPKHPDCLAPRITASGTKTCRESKPVDLWCRKCRGLCPKCQEWMSDVARNAARADCEVCDGHGVVSERVSSTITRQHPCPKCQPPKGGS